MVNENLEMNDNGLRYYSMKEGAPFSDKLDVDGLLKSISKGPRQEAENLSETGNQLPEESSSSRGRRSLGTKVASGSLNRPRKTDSAGCAQQQTQPGSASLSKRKVQRRRTPIKKPDPSDEERTTPLKLRRQKVSTSDDGESEPTEADELELTQFLQDPVPDCELWKWATPAIFGLEKGPKFYTQCCKGTPQAPQMSFQLGDSVQLVGPGTVKYFGVVARLFQRHRREQDQKRFEYIDQRVYTVWFYREVELPKKRIEEVREKLRKKGLDPKAALFISQHADVNPLHKVQHPIKLQTVEEYLSTTSEHDPNDYFLAGVYDSYSRKVYCKLRGDFSLPELLRYFNLERQSRTGEKLEMPNTPTRDWLEY